MRRPIFRHTASLIALAALLHAAPANADCPAAPIGNANDMAISFLASNGVQASSASLLASSIKEGTLVYDDANDVLKICDGTSWIEVGSGGGSGLSGGTSGYLGVWSGATTMGLSSTTAGQNLFWDATNHRLGVGTTTPAAALSVIDQTNAGVRLEQHHAGDGVNIRTYSSSGTIASPTALAAGKRMMGLTAFGHNGTGFSSAAAHLSFYAAENFTTSATGTYITMTTTPNGSTTSAERLRVNPNGNIGIGTMTPASMLHVAGGIQLGDDAATCPGASDVKVGTLRFNTGNLQLCTTGGWGAISGGGGSTSVGTAGYVQLSDGAGGFDYSGTTAGEQLFWDNTNKRLGIGTASPTAVLHVEKSADANVGTYIRNVNTGTAARAVNTFIADSHGFDIFAASSTFAGSYGSVPVAGAAVIRTFSSAGARPTSFMIGTGGADPLHLISTGVARLTVMPSGKILIGTQTDIQSDGSINPHVQVHGTSATAGSLSLTAWTTGASSPGSLVLGRSRSTTIGTNAIVNDGDTIGGVFFNADDGTGFKRVAWIDAQVDGTPGANDMPGRLRFLTTADGAASPTERMRITSSGNVGIGTTAPDVPLEFAATTGEKIRLWDGGAGSRIGIGLNSADFQFFTGTGGNNFSFNTGGDLQATGTNELMRIQANGNVGIGTASPDSPLHLFRTSMGLRLLTGSTTSGYTADIGVNDDGVNFSNNSAARGYNFKNLNGTLMSILANGNVGIGATAPKSRLQIGGYNTFNNLDGGGASSDWAQNLYYSSGWKRINADPGSVVQMVGGDFKIWTTPTGTADSAATLTQAFTLLNTGNVGIGTSTPGSALDVKGTLRLSGSTSGYVGFAPAAAAGSTTYTLPSADGSSGQVLSTNGSGTLSWATAGVAGITYLTTLTASNSATLDYTGISATYDTYLFILENVIPTNNGQPLQTRISTDGGSTWRTSSYLTSGSTSAIPTSLGVKTDGAGAGLGVSGNVTIYGVNRTDNKKMVRTETCGPVDDGYGATYLNCPTNYNGYWTGGNNAVNGVRFYFGTGNISSGRIRVYGLKTS